jgi:hypothetical protein
LNISDTMGEHVDPVTHLVIPLLVLLVARQNPRLVVPLAFFAILPDFDSLLGPHRMVLHNVFVILLIPLAFIAFARLRRPDLLLPGMIVLFYLSSHLMLDLDGVALFYPLDETAYKFIPVLEFYTAPDVHFVFYFDWGAVPLEQKTQYNLLSQLSFAYLLFLVTIGTVYRKELKGWTKKSVDALKTIARKFKVLFRKKGAR